MEYKPRGKSSVAIIVMAWASFLAPETYGDNWPRFRGPNGTGVSPDTDIPVHWTDGSILWKTSVPGVGNSSPVVWGDRIFLQSASPDGSKRWLLCVNARDGAIAWSKALPGASARKHPKNTLASSTPAVDGRRVYVMVWDGRNISVAAFNFQGEQLWERGLGSFTSQHGPGVSPMVFEDKVFLANDQDGSSELVALDSKSGKMAWKAPRRGFRACYSTPFILERPRTPPELIVASTAGVTSYVPGTGAENWSWNWTFSRAPLRTVASPIYSDGLVILCSGDGSGERHTVAIRVPSAENPRAELVWESKHGFPYVPSMLAQNGCLYFVHDRGLAGCCRTSSGEMLWNERLGGDISASPILIDGKIYAVSEDGSVVVIPAATSFRVLAKNSLGEPVIATPAVAGNRLFIRAKNHLFCIGKPAGKERAG